MSRREDGRPSRRLGSRGRALRPDARPARPPARDHLGRRAGQRPPRPPTTSSTCSSRSSTTGRSPSKRRARRRSRRATSARSRSCSPSRPVSPASRRTRRDPAAGLHRHPRRPRLPNVCAALVDPETGAVVPQAAAGWQLEELRPRGTASRGAARAAARREFLREGCYLLTHDQARARLASEVDVYPSQLNGRGPVGMEPSLARSSRCRTAAARCSGSSGSTTRPTGSCRRPTGCRRCGSSPTTPPPRSSRGRHLGELRFLADHDPLTRLLNRRAFVDRLEGEVARAVRYERSFGLVVTDLDGFKQLNDRYGHAAGDEALVAFANVARASRCGSPTTPSASAATSSRCCSPRRRRRTRARSSTRVETLLAAAGRSAASRGPPTSARASAAACLPEDANDAQTLFRLADEALYDAKRNGNGLRFVGARTRSTGPGGVAPAMPVRAAGSPTIAPCVGSTEHGKERRRRLSRRRSGH